MENIPEKNPETERTLEILLVLTTTVLLTKFREEIDFLKIIHDSRERWRMIDVQKFFPL